ncbi:hypothetical protein POM88_019302 [Heracleum sosnowskyi]|uniref:F-box domain-containing protein n=1 Tax=Heracleum sosnowskyi TaxID=360622 RepID=A0AAD8ITY6_9APIA|nr:hypothetical protein POM88_019302 [Heracleum sosnowskyi]
MSDNIHPQRYIPEEVVENILSWLPPVDIIRSTLVCRMWLGIVERSEFQKFQRVRAHKNPIAPRRYVRSPLPFETGEICIDRFTFHSDDAPLSITEEFNHPFLFTYYCDVVGSSNGVFLITDIEYNSLKMILWNPSIRRYFLIPTEDLEQVVDGSQELVLGMWYSPETDDYRVILLFYDFYEAPSPLFVRIFSLNTRTWSAYTKPVPRYHLSCPVSQVIVRDSLHWFARNTSGPNKILAFKSRDEVFSGIPLPPEVVNHYWILPALFDGCLAIYTFVKEDIQLWVMQEYCDVESWRVMLKLRTTDVVAPLEFRLSGEGSVEIFHFSRTDEELLCYNCAGKDNRTLDILCCEQPQMGFFTDSMGLYSESSYIVVSKDETNRSERFIAELVNLCVKSLDKKMSVDEEHSVAVLPDPASNTLTIRDNGMGLTEQDLLNSLDIRGDFGSSEDDTMSVTIFGGLKHLLRKVIVRTTEDQYVMEAQPGETLSLSKDTGGEVLARGTEVVLFLNDDQADCYLDKRVLTTLLNKYLGNSRRVFHVGVDE